MKLLRPLAALSLAVAAALALASCMSIRGDITLDRQARASSQVVLELSKQAASLMGITSVDAFRSQMAADSGDRVVVSETADAYRMTAKLDHQALNDQTGMFATFDRGSTQAPGTGLVRFSLSFADQGATTDDTSMLKGMNLGTIDLTIHFPGQVAYLQGPGVSKVDSHTARINTPLTTEVMSAATSANGSWVITSTIDPPKPVIQRVLLIAVPAVIVVLMGLGGVFAWRRFHHPPAETSTPSEPTEPVEPTEPAKPAEPISR